MFELQRDYPQDNVFRYAIAKASSVAISHSNWPVFQQFLVRSARSNSSVLDFVALLLFEAVQYRKPVDARMVVDLACDLIEDGVPTGHDFEVIWALLLCRELSLALGPGTCEIVSRSKCSLAAIIALDLERRGLAKYADKSNWQSLVYGDGLWSSNWLLAYEARARSWLYPGKGKKWTVKEEPFFAEMAKRKVRFYSTRTNPIRLGGLRKALIENALARSY